MIDDDPISMQYVSKPHYVEEKLEGLKVIYIKDLKPEAAEVIIH